MTTFFDFGKTFVPPVSLAPETTALLVIDMQYSDASPQGFHLAMNKIYPGSVDYFLERNETVTIPAIKELIAIARSSGVRIVYLTIGAEHRDLREFPARTRRWIRDVEERSGEKDLFWCGSELFAIREEIAPEAEDTVINKHAFGAFNGSNLEHVLQRMGVESLVITGISTNHCVETTARDAADRGYGCVIVDEATADYDDEAQIAALQAYHFNFGRVVKSPGDVARALESGAEI